MWAVAFGGGGMRGQWTGMHGERREKKEGRERGWEGEKGGRVGRGGRGEALEGDVMIRPLHGGGAVPWKMELLQSIFPPKLQWVKCWGLDRWGTCRSFLQSHLNA